MSLSGFIRIPALVDMHVHFREPGFSQKETILSGSSAAMCSGYSDVFTMPNLNPAPDSIDNLNIQKGIIKYTKPMKMLYMMRNIRLIFLL